MKVRPDELDRKSVLLWRSLPTSLPITSDAGVQASSVTISHGRFRILTTTQRIAVVIAAVFYIAAGSLHFISPAPNLRIMPPYIPSHVAMVRISGGLLDGWNAYPTGASSPVLHVASVLLLDKEGFDDSNTRQENEGCGD